MLQTQKLTKDYGQGKGVFELDLEVKPGEVVGFLGPNGAGKSTTIGMISGLIRPNRGNFKVFDKPVDYLSLPKYNQQIGFMFSEPIFDQDLKVKHIFQQSQTLLGKQLDKNWTELAKFLDLDLNRRFRDFSLGNKKKVGLVNAIMHQPKLLIMDEPTSGLDPLIQQKFQHLVLNLAQKGTAILLSSHILTEVESICSRIIMIKNGRVILQDTTKNIQSQALKVFTLPLLTPQVSANIQLMQGVVRMELSATQTKVWTSQRAPLLNYLHQIGLTEFYLERASLEEMFLQFYK